MSPNLSRRRVLQTVAVGTASLGLTGCLGTGGEDATPEESPTDTTPQTTERATTTTPAIAEDVAEERAMDAETERVRERLESASCLDDWGIGGYTTNPEATVQTVTDRGFVVEVVRPYSWERDGTVADGVSNARYVVSENTTQRLSGHGLSAPC